MSLYVIKPKIIELSSFIKYARHIYYLRNYQNVLIASKLNNTDIKLHNLPLNSISVNEFSTANTLLKSKDKYKDKKKAVHVNLNEIEEFVEIERMKSQFDGTIEKFKEQMVQHLGVRTRLGAIEGLPITFEKEEYKLEELVEISRKPNIIVLNVSAFPQMIPNVLEAITNSQMNLNPQQDGTTIYIPLPKVTKEHRENLSKTAKQYFVKCKDLISDVRNEHIRELKKQETVPTDVVFKAENYISALQKEYVDKAEQLLKAKQKELLGET